MKVSYIVSFILCLFSLNLNAQQEIYEIRTYELGFFRPANLLHDYFEKALIPAFNRQGITYVGAFEEEGEGLPKKIYLLITYPDLQHWETSSDQLQNDSVYLKEATNYLKAPETSMPFTSYSSNLIHSSQGFPNLVQPDASSQLFELRIYHSHNEDALRRKVKMFNDHEFPIFADAGLQMVFFGVDMVGNHLPCLTYMLATTDKHANSEGWSKFVNHPKWKRIVNLEEYANSMNNISRVFLKRLTYSQL